MTYTKFELEKLTRDLHHAIRHGLIMAGKIEDGGSCNLDSLFFQMPKGRRATSRIRQALEAAGCHAASWTSSMWRGYRLSFESPGQAAKNTVAVEAARRRLNELGWSEFEVFYQTD